MSEKDKKDMKRLMITLFHAGMDALSNDAEWNESKCVYLHNLDRQIFLNTLKEDEEIHHDYIIDIAADLHKPLKLR